MRDRHCVAEFPDCATAEAWYDRLPDDDSLPNARRAAPRVLVMMEGT